MTSIGGWDVSDVNYLLANAPSKLTGVEFDLNGSASMVKANLSTSGAFFACRNAGGYHWVCNADVSVSSSEIYALNVIATGG